MSLLSIIAVSLTVALSRLGEAAARSQRELTILRNLESLMTEALRNPVIEPVEQTLAPDAYGVVYSVLIEPIEGLETQSQVSLQDLFMIRIAARWLDNGVMQEELVETYRYGPLYSNTSG
jgi:hypothetical protein